MTINQTLEMYNQTNKIYCQVAEDMLSCMFDYNEIIFDKALKDLEIVRKNYETMNRFGNFTGNEDGKSIDRQLFDLNFLNLQSLSFDRELYRNAKRKLKVIYNGIERKIPKKLNQQKELLLSIKLFNCLGLELN